MPLPKRRHSNQRTRKRRTHYKLVHQPAMVPTAEGGFKLMHHVDPATGRYRSRQVFELADETQQEQA